MDPEAYRELQVLEEIAYNHSLTQRGLAKKLEVALGLTNLMIRRLANKGYIKLTSTQRNRLKYLITPKGIQQKTRLTYEYLEYSLHLYRRVRQILRENLDPLLDSGQTDIVIFGTGEIAEIAYLTIKELGLNLVGVVDDRSHGKMFFSLPILNLAYAATMPFDVGIISSLDEGLPETHRQLRALGIPAEKLIGIERNGAMIRAYPTHAIPRRKE